MDRGKVIVLNDSIVRYHSLLILRRSRSLEKKGAHECVVPPDVRVLLDDLGVYVGNEEDSREQRNTSTGTHSDRGDIPGRLLVKSELWRSFVNDGERANGASDKEEEGGSVDAPLDGIATHVHHNLDKHEDAGTKTSGNGGGHAQTSKNCTEALAFIPTPLHIGSSDRGDTDTGDGRYQRVGRRNVSGMPSAPHDPCRGTSECTGEGEHLDSGVTLEGAWRDNAVLDGFGSTGTDGDGSQHLENSTKDHGLTVGDGARRDTGCPGVGDIVGTIVEGVEQGKESAYGHDVVVFAEDSHLDGGLFGSMRSERLATTVDGGEEARGKHRAVERLCRLQEQDEQGSAWMFILPASSGCSIRV